MHHFTQDPPAVVVLPTPAPPTLFAATLAAVEELSAAVETPLPTLPSPVAIPVPSSAPTRAGASALVSGPTLFAGTSSAVAAMCKTPEPWGVDAHVASMQLQALAAAKAVQEAEVPAAQGPMAGLLGMLQEVRRDACVSICFYTHAHTYTLKPGVLMVQMRLGARDAARQQAVAPPAHNTNAPSAVGVQQDAERVPASSTLPALDDGTQGSHLL